MIEKKSTHCVEVVPITLEKHPNADSLSIIRLWGFQIIVKTADWADETIAAYVQPDMVVPDKPEYAFLRPCSTCKGNESVVCGDCNGTRVLPLRDTDRRIRVRKFRKEISQGLLVKAPAGSKVGDNVSDILGITRYVPPEPGSSSASLGKAPTYRGPSMYVPDYDVENWYRYGKTTFVDGEYVYLTEKIHGSNLKCVYSSVDKEFFVGSHHRWIRRYQTLRPKNRWHAFLQWLRIEKPVQVPTDNVWWRAANIYPEIEEWCRTNPDIVLYGEVYGDVQDLKYGHASGEISLAVYAMYHMGVYAFTTFKSLPVVPVVAAGPYSDDFVRLYIDGRSLVEGANHIREGIVIHGMGKTLKAVSDAYLERAK